MQKGANIKREKQVWIGVGKMGKKKGGGGVKTKIVLREREHYITST